MPPAGAHGAEGLARGCGLDEPLARIGGARAAEIGAQSEEGHQPVDALQRDRKPEAAARRCRGQRQHIRPCARHRLVDIGHEVGPGNRDLARGIDRHGPDMPVMAIARERRADERRVQPLEQVVEGKKAFRLRYFSAERMIENDQIELFREFGDGSEFEAVKRSCLPADLDVGMPLAECRERGRQGVYGTAVIPGDAAQERHCNRSLFLDSLKGSKIV
jgi:hypothetical protein